MELKRNHTKNLQALQRTHKFFSSAWQYIEFKDVNTLDYFYLEDKPIGKYLERIEEKHKGTTVPLEDTTDIDLSDGDYLPRGYGRRHWNSPRRSYISELKDFHECVFDVLKASIKQEKFDEV